MSGVLHGLLAAHTDRKMFKYFIMFFIYPQVSILPFTLQLILTINQMFIPFYILNDALY